MSWNLYIENQGRELYGTDHTSNTNRMLRMAFNDPDGIACLDGQSAHYCAGRVAAALTYLLGPGNHNDLVALNPPNGWGSWDSLTELLFEISTALAKSKADDCVRVSQ